MTTTALATSQISHSAEARQLVVVIGTGVSIALTGGKIRSVSWKGLIESGFEYAATKGKISTKQKKAWSNQLASNDLDDLLSASEFMGHKLGSPTGDLYPARLPTF